MNRAGKFYRVTRRKDGTIMKGKKFIEIPAHMGVLALIMEELDGALSRVAHAKSLYKEKLADSDRAEVDIESLEGCYSMLLTVYLDLRGYSIDGDRYLYRMTTCKACSFHYTAFVKGDDGVVEELCLHCGAKWPAEIIADTEVIDD